MTRDKNKSCVKIVGNNTYDDLVSFHPQTFSVQNDKYRNEQGNIYVMNIPKNVFVHFSSFQTEITTVGESTITPTVHETTDDSVSNNILHDIVQDSTDAIDLYANDTTMTGFC